jgi:hypothetical protein
VHVRREHMFMESCIRRCLRRETEKMTYRKVPTVRDATSEGYSFVVRVEEGVMKNWKASGWYGGNRSEVRSCVCEEWFGSNEDMWTREWA